MFLFLRSATGYEGVSNGFCRGCLSGGASWPRLEVAHPPPDTNYCIASSASGCPIELSSRIPLILMASPRFPPPFCGRTPGLRTIPRSQSFAFEPTHASRLTCSALSPGMYSERSGIKIIRICFLPHDAVPRVSE